MAPHRALRGIYSLEDLEPAARRRLPRPLFGYVSEASETRASLIDNRAVFDEIGFLPRALVDVSGRRLDRTALGKAHSLPFGIAPMGVSALTAYRGDIVLARAARRAGIPMVISGAGLIALEEIARENPDAWFQAYLPRDTGAILALTDRVARAGIDTLVVTVDSSVGPILENYLRHGYRTPIRPGFGLLRDGIVRPRWAFGTFLRTILRHGVPHFENSGPERGAPLLSRRAVRDFSGRETLDWAVARLIRERWRGRLVIKGILAPADVARARAEGMDAVILSNHGGRQLDGSVAPMRVLPAALAEAGDMEVMIDCGFRRGTDILKALALGARFVFVGRPFNYAAALAGEAGVDHAIGLLRAQLRAGLGMLGLCDLDALGPGALFAKDFRALPAGAGGGAPE